MAVSYGTSSGDTYWDIRMDTGDELPFDGVPNGSTVILNDNQLAGAMFFSKAQDCWIDMNGRKWTRGDKVWTP